MMVSNNPPNSAEKLGYLRSVPPIVRGSSALIRKFFLSPVLFFTRPWPPPFYPSFIKSLPHLSTFSLVVRPRRHKKFPLEVFNKILFCCVMHLFASRLRQPVTYNILALLFSPISSVTATVANLSSFRFLRPRSLVFFLSLRCQIVLFSPLLSPVFSAEVILSRVTPFPSMLFPATICPVPGGF